jgi:hypothetical protein
MPISQTPYNHEADDTSINGILLEADSLEEAEAKIAELDCDALLLCLTDDPEAS